MVLSTGRPMSSVGYFQPSIGQLQLFVPTSTALQTYFEKVGSKKLRPSKRKLRIFKFLNHPQVPCILQFFDVNCWKNVRQLKYSEREAVARNLSTWPRPEATAPIFSTQNAAAGVGRTRQSAQMCSVSQTHENATHRHRAVCTGSQSDIQYTVYQGQIQNFEIREKLKGRRRGLWKSCFSAQRKNAITIHHFCAKILPDQKMQPAVIKEKRYHLMNPPLLYRLQSMYEIAT